ncbi:MAG: tRNA lysidine(34) synthetase TilS [Marinifilaceae bacterium]|jgi:tRNA(Ile)-lysidine synthase|nr:tRNA lysidine(34) synthetase TilS [Marinifilaceae bacterium]
MIRKFVKYIDDNNLFFRDEKLLVGVSGGVDSVVLLDLLHKLELECVVAHCNFKLRAEESDQDALFVENLAKGYSFEFVIKEFDTKEYAKQKSISIEMAARNLRYDWFSGLMKEYFCQYLAVGHHIDDSIETVFINLARGTGINGITGISPKNENNTIRPLLCFKREDILKYAKHNNLEYREDSTNKTTEFHRNKIRHNIIPAMTELSSGFKDVMSNNILHFKDIAEIYSAYIELSKTELLSQVNGDLLIDINKLKKKAGISSLLFEILKDFGFNSKDTRQISESIFGHSGKQFLSASYTVLIDREFIIISKKKLNSNFHDILISEMSDLSKYFDYKVLSYSELNLVKDKRYAYIDRDKLKFPLKLRKWQRGDLFCPFGMKGKKKLSDYMIDRKMSLIEKDELRVLENSNSEIIWIVNERLDRRYAFTQNTENILILTKIM